MSPKAAPEITAPAVIPAGTPIAVPIPTIASPAVPIVPHDVPVAKDVNEQTRSVVRRNALGDIALRPSTIISGTVPLAISAATIVPTMRMMKLASSDSITIFHPNPWVSL